MNLNSSVKNWMPPGIIRLGKQVTGRTPQQLIQRYLSGDRTPWTPGYGLYKQQFIQQTLQNSELLDRFSQGQSLLPDYGYGLDERCVEYPWLFSRLPATAKTLLDAGSVLNFEYLLDQPYFADRQLHIATLAPEPLCFWQKGISYLFVDLRQLPLQNDCYDAIICLSTLEHVGLDNTQYTHSDRPSEIQLDSYKMALQELRRVLKPGGSLFLSVPFGKYQNFGDFQQFDSALLTAAIATFGAAQTVESTFFRYSANGWQVATEADCVDCEYVHGSTWNSASPAQPKPDDLAAAARAVACIHLVL